MGALFQQVITDMKLKWAFLFSSLLSSLLLSSLLFSLALPFPLSL